MKLTRIPTRNLSEQEWQEVRKELTTRGMVGGSDASTLLGLNQYKSPINMFYQAVGLVDQPNKMNSAMLHGKQLEDYVAKCWQYWDGTEEGWVNNTNTGNKIKKYRKVKAIIINPKFPSLFANIDGRIVQHPDRTDPGILEVKTMSGYSADMWEAGIPPGYYAQIQHYMLVTGLKWGELVYLKDGRELGVVKFEEDKDMQNRILDAANEFKERVEMAYAAIKDARSPEEAMQLASNYEPPADNTDAFSKFISEKHKARQDEVHIHGGIELAKWMDEYREASETIKEQELRKTLASNTLRQHMEKEGATAMTLPNGKITWRQKFTVKYEQVA
jgi:putative phage-type endonuclease